MADANTRDLTLALRIKALVQGADSIEDLRRELDELLDESERDAHDPTRELREGAEETRRSVAGLTDELQSGLKGALAGLVGIGAIQQFIEINTQAETLRKTLTLLTGSTEASAAEVQWLTETSNRLGVSIQDVSKAYIGLATSAKGTALEGQKTREIFEAVVGAMAAMGKSGQEAEQALTAISQMMGKGTISAEELRGQLEEALPGASRALAAALDMTVADLNQLVATGGVVSSDVLPALAEQLKKTYQIGGQGSDTLQAQLARLKNAYTEVVTQFGNTAALSAFKEAAIIAAVGLRELYGGFELAGTAAGAFIAALANWDFSSFNQTMQDTSDKLTREVAAIARYSDTIGPLFEKSAAGADRLSAAQTTLAGKTAQTGAAADATAGSLTKLQFNYQQLQQTLDLTIARLDRVAAAQQAWANVAQQEAALRGNLLAQTRAGIALAEQDAQTKQKQATELARAADSVQHYLEQLRQQQDVLPDTIDATEKDAIAKNKEADAAAAAAQAARLHADAVRGSSGVLLAALGEQGASAEQARAKVAQLQAEYDRLKASGAGLGALAEKADELAKAQDAARIAAQGWREEQAVTLGQLDQLKSKLDGSIAAQTAYNEALRRYKEQTAVASTALERRNGLIETARQADIAATKAAADLAGARGDEAGATQLAIQALEQEAALARDRVTRKQQEVAALQAVVEAKLREADADNIRTQAEREGIQIAKDAVAAKQNEVAAAEAAVVAKDAAVEASYRLADAQRKEVEIAGENAQAVREGVSAIGGLNQAMRALSENAYAAWQEGLVRIYGTLERLPPRLDGASEAVQALNTQLQQTQQIAQSNSRVISSMTDGFDRAVEVADRIRVKFYEQALQAQRLTEQLNAMAQSGRIGMATLAQATQGAAGAFDLLDQQRLDQLQNAIDAATDRLRQMQEEASDAKDRLAELNAEIAREKGDDATAEKLRLELEQRQALAEVEAKLAQARLEQNQELVRLYEEQKQKLQELYDIKERNLKQDRQQTAQTAAGPAAGSAGSSGKTYTVQLAAPSGRTLTTTTATDPAAFLGALEQARRAAA
jgi:tape measure domain-containing protein